MFKKMMLAVVAGSIAATLGAAELKFSGNQIKANQIDMNMLANGAITLRHQENVMIAHLLPTFTTKAKGTWFSFGNPECKPQLTRPDAKTWSYKSQIPLNNQKGVLPVTMTVAPNPFNAIDIETLWKKPANPKDLSEAGLFVTIQTKLLLDNPLILDGQKIKVINQSKYGWFNKMATNPQLTLYSGQPGREFTLAFQGKYYITIASTVNGPTVLRFNTMGTAINYTVTIR